MANTLLHTTESRIRFSEVDSMRVVWHGNYAKFLEDGREAFGAEYCLGYNDVFKHGYMTPIVDLQMKYKRVIEYGDTIRIETRFVPTPAAKIIFDYKIIRTSDNLLVHTARSIQVFMDMNRELVITTPEFFVEWKKKNGVE